MEPIEIALCKGQTVRTLNPSAIPFAGEKFLKREP
jgi:hypothetical protein